MFVYRTRHGMYCITRCVWLQGWRCMNLCTCIHFRKRLQMHAHMTLVSGIAQDPWQENQAQRYQRYDKQYLQTNDKENKRPEKLKPYPGTYKASACFDDGDVLDLYSYVCFIQDFKNRTINWQFFRKYWVPDYWILLIKLFCLLLSARVLNFNTIITLNIKVNWLGKYEHSNEKWSYRGMRETLIFQGIKPFRWSNKRDLWAGWRGCACLHGQQTENDTGTGGFNINRMVILYNCPINNDKYAVADRMNKNSRSKDDVFDLFVSDTEDMDFSGFSNPDIWIFFRSG